MLDICEEIQLRYGKCTKYSRELFINAYYDSCVLKKQKIHMKTTLCNFRNTLSCRNLQTATRGTFYTFVRSEKR